MSREEVLGKLGRDSREWIAQVHRARQRMEVAVCSMPGGPEVSGLLDYIEEECLRFAKLRSLGASRRSTDK